MIHFEWPTFVQVLEFLGTFAFSISGIRLASAKRFDWFGAYVVGVAAAIGGGTIRDVMLGLIPFWMTDPIYLICSAIALIWVIIFNKQLISQNNTFFIFDSIGLALFTVVGINKTIVLGYPLWVAIIMGCITGAAGGVIRDVLLNKEPIVFQKDIYAMASVYQECKLSAPAETPASGGGALKWYGYREVTTGNLITPSVRCGSTVIKTGSAVGVSNNGFTLYSLSLSETEMANITDWSNVRIRFAVSSYSSQSIEICMAYLEVPDKKSSIGLEMGCSF